MLTNVTVPTGGVISGQVAEIALLAPARSIY
jgi:hypothetical protein